MGQYICSVGQFIKSTEVLIATPLPRVPHTRESLELICSGFSNLLVPPYAGQMINFCSAANGCESHLRLKRSTRSITFANHARRVQQDLINEQSSTRVQQLELFLT